MRDRDCVAFLQRWLPRLGLRWAGYRKVRRTVRKRLGRRLSELGLADLNAYGLLLEADPQERRHFDACCRIPISRFYRDRRVFEALGHSVLPDLAGRAAARGDREIRCWSAGCASGEEAYSLRILWKQAGAATPGIGLSILGTDADAIVLQRAEKACYGRGSLKDLPPDALDRAFVQADGLFCLRPEFRQGVTFARQDIRTEMPAGMFDLVLCRNLAFTYFDRQVQAEVLTRIDEHLGPQGVLVIGGHESLPAGASGFGPLIPHLPIFSRDGLPGPGQNG